MKATLFLLTLFLLNVKLAACQERSFELNGTVNIDTGYMQLTMIGDSSLYPEPARHLTSPIQNGKFKFSGKIPYPMAYLLKTTSYSYVSDVIVLEPGIQSVVCDADSSRKMPDVKNKVMLDYARYKDGTKEFNDRDKAFDNEYKILIAKYPKGIPETLRLKMELELQALYDEGDRNLLAFIKENPGSYWAIWRLIHLTNFGYEKIFDEMLPLFNDAIKTSYLGKQVSMALQKSNVLAVGNKFPRMDLLQINGTQSPGISFKGSKYTLVDFWYTNCGPCIRTFPDLVALYGTYKMKGFEIAGIAVDALKYQKDLPVVIKKHNLTWSHYWDMAGKGSKDLSIASYPTNFLVDANGIIIHKNIGGAELTAFLRDNI
jgi:thiol-disulfide isomerase/thioredoxin